MVTPVCVVCFQAMQKEDERVREVDKILAMDERKRKYNSMYTDAAPTEEELEAYRRKQKRFEDPMAHLWTNWIRYRSSMHFVFARIKILYRLLYLQGTFYCYANKN